MQNTNRSISILYEFHTEYLFESNLYWVYSNIHVTQIAFLDWLTSWIINEFYKKLNLPHRQLYIKVHQQFLRDQNARDW